MTILELILIIYILLNWLSLIMVGILPLKKKQIIPFLLIVCPPLIFGLIFELIMRNIKKRKDIKEEEK